MKVLVSAPYMLRHEELPKIKSMIANMPYEFDFANVKERLEETDLLKIIENYDAIICGDDRFTKAVYQKAKRLKVVVKWGTGIDSLNAEIAKEFNIPVLRTPGAFTEPVSDSTVGLMLSFCRNIKKNDDLMKAGEWDKPQGFTLSELKIGLIGFGDIGKAVAKKLEPFNCNIYFYDKNQNIDPIHSKCIKSDLNSVLENCDIISLHCDLNESSHHILNEIAFSKMKKRPFIINTARGPLIKESALESALKNNTIAGAGLDVFEDEPLAKSSPLRSNPNVLLSSHNTNSSPACWMKVHENCFKLLREGLNK